MFATKVVPKDYAEEVYDALVRQGVISPILISKYKFEDWQVEPLRNKFKLSKKDINEFIDNMKNDPRSQTFNKDTELDVNIMIEHAKLSYRIDFWMQLRKLNVFIHAKENQEDSEEFELEERIKHVILIDNDYKEKIPEWLAKLTPVPKPDLETSRYQIRLSNEIEHGLMYDFLDILNDCDPKCINEIENLVKSNVLRHDWIGQINTKVLRRIGYLDRFDGITTIDIADFFDIDHESAAWIIDLLIENGVLKRDTVPMHRFTKDEKLWHEKVAIHMDKGHKDETNLIIKHADGLVHIRNQKLLKNITTGMIDHFCKIGNREQLFKFFELLKNEKLLEPIFFTKFRLYGKLDCSCLPSCIANEIDELLNDRLAYSFALEHLCVGLDDSMVDPTAPKKLFLQENAANEFYEELLNSGIGIKSHISEEDYQLLDLDFYQYRDELKEVISNHRTKLWDQTHYHMEFLPSAAYFAAQGYTIDTDSKAIIENGLLMVISKRREDLIWSAQNTVIKNVVKAGKAVWSATKSVGNWFYSIGSSICQFVSPVVNFCTDTFNNVVESGMAIGREVKGKIVETVNYIAEIEVVKMATQTIKDVANTVGDALVTVADITGISTASRAVVNAVKEVGTVVRNTVTAVGTDISDAVTAAGKYIADTRIFKAAKQAFNIAMDFAKSTYQKMSAYVTAAYESYMYYNQCRFTARRLALQQDIADEHFIIRNYNNSLAQENRVQNNDNIFEEVRTFFSCHLSKS